MLKKLVVVAATALAVSGVQAQTAGGTITGSLPGGCMFASPVFSFPVGTIDFARLAVDGFYDSPQTVSAGCSTGVTGSLTLAKSSYIVDSDLSVKIRRAGECGSATFTPAALTGTGSMQNISVCLRLYKTNAAASNLALGVKSISATEAGVFSIAVN